jgi:alkaline phosphatase
MIAAEPPQSCRIRGWRMTIAIAIAIVAGTTLCAGAEGRDPDGDPVRAMQIEAVENGRSPFVHWGTDPSEYAGYGSHSNRLVPVYTYGTASAAAAVDLRSYAGENSVYRNKKRLIELYGRLPAATLNPRAEYFDQTDLFQLQRAALEAGKRNIFLVIFDGLDWNSVRAAALAAAGEGVYERGRGHGLFFLDYVADGTSQFGSMVVSSYAETATTNVDAQTVGDVEPGGGYDAHQGGAEPWHRPGPSGYLIGRPVHAVTDSSASAASMTTGLKTYNGALNVDIDGRQLTTIAHLAQRRGYVVGAVSSVPFSHATPAAAYAHNVSRGDYQDIARDMLGLPSVSHPDKPLPGMDVVIGAGIGLRREMMASQGKNYLPGGVFVADEDLRALEGSKGWVVSRRRPGIDGGGTLLEAAERAARSKRRLLGYYGTQHAHLPYRTADGDYRPAPDAAGPGESYTPQELLENPTLEEMTRAALWVLATRGDEGMWLIVESGDVDWASHDNNLDTMIGAIYSGDAAVRAIVRWVEANSNWQESLMIVTGDHGHYLVVDEPAAFAEAVRRGR